MAWPIPPGRHRTYTGGDDDSAAAPVHLRPPLKWAGGKRWQVPHVRRIWKGHERRRLVEPFCGGLAVALGLLPRRALLNDVNAHLVSFYRQLADGLTIGVPMENASEASYAHRQTFNALLAADRGPRPRPRRSSTI